MHVFVLNTKDDIVKVCNRAASGIIDSAPHVMQYILGLMKSVLFFLEIHFFPLNSSGLLFNGEIKLY